jgi:hypothetical protein
MAKGSMREKMPLVSAWIDGLREAFGAQEIDGQIRAGMRGEPVFFASENGHTVGTPSPPGWRVLKDEKGNRTVVMDGDRRVEDQTDDGDRRKQLKGAMVWEK